MLHQDEKINSILERFLQYLETSEAKGHISSIEKEIKEVNDMMKTLSKMDKNGDEFTELVLYGLLPYGKSAKAKRLSTFPSFQDIKVFFRGLKRTYTDKEWNYLANLIFDLCKGFEDDPKKLNSLVKKFTDEKYSWRIQCGSITPILFCINQDYPIVNNRVINTYWSIQDLLGEDKNLSQKLSDYPSDVEKLKEMVDSLGLKLIKDKTYLDLFCFWYHEYTLKEEADRDETELRGYKNVSTFLRESALTQRKHIELKIIETNKLHFETNNEIKKIKERIDKIMEILKNPKL